MSADAERFIVLLRGINVGGHKKLPMATLRTLCADLGCTGVSTYIQSGNVVLDSELSEEKLMGRLESAIQDAVGFTPRIVVRRRDDLVQALAGNPFPETDMRYLHIGFMSETPTADAVAELSDVDCAPEGFQIEGREIYLNYVNGAGASKKLAKVPFERTLGVAITARNLRTVNKLVELADQSTGAN